MRIGRRAGCHAPGAGTGCSIAGHSSARSTSGAIARVPTALAPVLVANADRFGLSNLYLDLDKVGLGRRLPWLVQNTTEAIDLEIDADPPRAWAQRARRAAVLLSLFLDSVANGRHAGPDRPLPLDAFDPTIRSKKTLEDVAAASSVISRQWGIVSTLQPRDFAQALRAARAARP